MKNRMIAFLITACVLLSCLSMTAFASGIPDVVEPGMDGGDVPASAEDIAKLPKEQKKQTTSTEKTEQAEPAGDNSEDDSEQTEATRGYRADDQCGEKLLWNLDEGKLVISGSGPMDDYVDDNPPWFSQRTKIKQVVLSGEVTTIGAGAFENCDNITEVDFGEHLTGLGAKAFSFCDGLTSITLPATFKNFGEECLAHCVGLKEIHCQGSMPHFRLNCVWDTYAKIYFPADNPWPVQSIQELEEAFHQRIEFLASDGSDPYEPAPTEEVTIPTTAATEEPEDEEPTTEQTTEPETTEPETEAPTETKITPATVEETMLLGDSTDVTEEPQQQPSRSGGKVGLILVLAVLSLLGIGAIIFRVSESKRRGRYDR